MGRGPARIRGRTRLAHAIVPMVLRKRACAMPKQVTPIGTIRRWNRAAALFGSSAAEALGQ